MKTLKIKRHEVKHPVGRATAGVCGGGYRFVCLFACIPISVLANLFVFTNLIGENDSLLHVCIYYYK